MSVLLKENPFIRNASSYDDRKANENKIKKKRRSEHHTVQRAKNKVSRVNHAPITYLMLLN